MVLQCPTFSQEPGYLMLLVGFAGNCQPVAGIWEARNLRQLLHSKSFKDSSASGLTADPSRWSTFGRTQFCHVLPSFLCSFCHKDWSLSASIHWNTMNMLLIYFGYLADIMICFRVAETWLLVAGTSCHGILLWHATVARTAFRPCSISWRRFSNILVRHISFIPVFDVLEAALSILTVPMCLWLPTAHLWERSCGCDKVFVLKLSEAFWSNAHPCDAFVILFVSYSRCLPCLPCLIILMPSWPWQFKKWCEVLMRKTHMAIWRQILTWHDDTWDVKWCVTQRAAFRLALFLSCIVLLSLAL